MKVSVEKLSHHPKNREIYDLSSIDTLMTSIQEVGLLQSLVIDQHNQVISGNRRLEAVRRLNWKSVEIEKVDVEPTDTIPLIISYNQQRVKTNREILQEYWALEKVLGIGQGKRTDLDTTSVSSDRSSKNPRTRDIIAKQLGISSTQLGLLLYIHNRNPDFLDLIDDGTITINKAYQRLQNGHKYAFAHGENRNENDFYTTPYSLTEQLLRVEDFNKDLDICKPATGKDGITNVLRKYWKPELITSYDKEQDFFKDTNNYEYIITNPPFSKSLEFIHQAKRRAKNKFCLLLPLNFLHGKKRYEEVYTDKEYGLSKVHIFTRSLLMDDKPNRTDGLVKGGMLVFAWYVFENGYKDFPTISWIDNSADIIKVR